MNPEVCVIIISYHENAFPTYNDLKFFNKLYQLGCVIKRLFIFHLNCRDQKQRYDFTSMYNKKKWIQFFPNLFVHFSQITTENSPYYHSNFIEKFSQI